MTASAILPEQELHEELQTWRCPELDDVQL